MAASAAFDYARRSLEEVLKIAGGGCVPTDLTACIQSQLEKLKEEELLVNSQLSVDLGTEKLKKTLLKGRMKDLGLDSQQIGYLLNERPEKELLDLSPTLKEKTRFSEKFYQVLDKLNIATPSEALGMTPEEISGRIRDSLEKTCLEASPVKDRIQSLNHTLQYLNDENIRLRYQLAEKDSEKTVPSAIGLFKQLEKEEMLECEKLGLMSHEYEEKIGRIKDEDKAIFTHMKDKIEALNKKVQQLTSKLQESGREIEMLQAALQSQNEQLNKEYIEHGMMLEKANQEVKALAQQIESMKAKEEKNLRSSHSTTTSNPLVPHPPLHLEGHEENLEARSMRTSVAGSSANPLRRSLFTPIDQPIHVFSYRRTVEVELPPEQVLKPLANKIAELSHTTEVLDHAVISQQKEIEHELDLLAKMAVRQQVADNLRHAIETQALEDSSHMFALREELEKTKNQLEKLQQEAIPRSAVNAEVNIYLSQISQMTKKIGQLEQELEKQARELWESRTEKGKSKRRIELLEERLKELETEEKGNASMTAEQQSEQVALKALLAVMSQKAQNALKELEREGEIIKETQKISLRKSEEIVKLKEKISHLESIPRGVPQEEVKKHLFMIGELAKRASAAEDKLNEQKNRFEALRREEDDHKSEIKKLSAKLKAVEEEDAQTKAQIKLRDEKIASFKKLLASSNDRLQSLAKENEELEAENKRDMKLLNDTMTESSRHLLQIGILAQLVRQLEADQKEFVKDVSKPDISQQDINEYVNKISELRMLLNRAEQSLLQKNQFISKLEAKDENLDKKLHNLRAKLHTLEEEEDNIVEESQIKDEQVALLKQSLDQALDKLTEEHKKFAMDEVQLERLKDELAYFKDECEVRGVTIQKLEQGVIMLEEVIDQDKLVEKGMREALEKKSQELLDVIKEEKTLKDQLRILSKKCEILEVSEESDRKAVQDSENLTKEYKQLYEETAKKYQDIALKKALLEKNLHERNLKPTMVSENVSTSMEEGMKNLEQLPPGIPKEQAGAKLEDIAKASAGLQAARQQQQANERDLQATASDQRDNVQLVFMLEEKIKELEAASHQVAEDEKKAHEQEILRFKAMLLTATERMRDLSMQNNELKEMHRMDSKKVEVELARVNELLMDLEGLAEELGQAEAENKDAVAQIQEYQESIEVFRNKLSESEKVAAERERSLHEIEAKDKKHQDLIVELYKQIQEREATHEQEKALIEQQNQKIAELRAKLNQSAGAITGYMRRQRSLEDLDEPADALIKRLKEQNEQYLARISMLTKRIKSSEISQKKLEEGPLTSRLASMNETIQGLESKNSDLSTKLETQSKLFTSQMTPMNIASESLQKSKTMAGDELSLKEEMARLQAEVEYLRQQPRGVPEDIVEQARIRNAELQAKIRTLEAALKERDMKTFLEGSPLRKLSKQVDALRDRLCELEAEKNSSQGKPFEKESELFTLTRLFNELKSKLDGTATKEFTLSKQIVKPADMQATPEQEDLSSLKSKVDNLQPSASLVSEKEYEDKITTIKELSSKLYEDESMIKKQASELVQLRDRSDQLLTTLVVLNEKIGSLEREEKHEEEFIQERQSEIDSLKDALKETIGHLKTVTDKNFELEEQHKIDQQKMSQNIAKMNTNLIGIAALAQKNKDLENERTEETNRYLGLINQLNSDLIATEKRLKESKDALNLTKEADQEHQAQILRLSQRIATLEEEERQLIERDENVLTELANTKNELAKAIEKLHQDEIQNELLKKALVEDASKIRTFEEETVSYANILSNLNKKVKQIKHEQDAEHFKEITRYLRQLASLSKMLKDTEAALLMKNKELNGEKEVEQLQEKHTKLLYNKIEELENIEASTESALEAKTRELEFYKDLLKQTTERLNSHLTPMPQGGAIQAHKLLPKNLPPTLLSNDKEAIAEYLVLVKRMDSQLTTRDALLRKEASRLMKLREIKGEHTAEIQRLSQRLKDLQEEKSKETETDKKLQESKSADLKRMLDDTTKRLQAILEENNELRQLHKQEMTTIDQAISESSKHFLKIASMENKLKKVEESLKTETAEHQTKEQHLREQLQATEAELHAKIVTLKEVEAVEEGHEQEITSLLGRINDLEELDQKNTELLRAKLEELDTLRAVLRDTILNLEVQMEDKDAIRDKIMSAKEMIENELKQEHSKVEEKEAQITELQDAVELFALDALTISQNEAKARSVIETLTRKIAELEAERLSNTARLDQDEGELDMYKLMLVDWRNKLVQQTHINQVFKNKIVEEGQILAMKSSMWPASQFSLLLTEVKRLEELPSMIQNRDISQSVNEINGLLTDLVIQEDDFITVYNKFTKLQKGEKHTMIESLSKVLECSSPSSQDNRCFKLAIDETKDFIEELKKQTEEIDTSQERLGFLSNHILTILDKISVNLANIALILESAEQGSEVREGLSPELDHYLQILNNLSQKITRIAGNFEETMADNRKRLEQSSHSVYAKQVMDILAQFQAIETFDDNTPRPVSSIKEEKSSSNLQSMASQAADIKVKLEEEEQAIPRAVELVGVLSQRIIFLEEEKRAQQKLSIKEKIELLRLLLKASTIMSVHAKTEVLSESDIDELTEATSSLAAAYVDDEVSSKKANFHHQQKKLLKIAKKLQAKVSHSLGLNSLIHRAILDLERLDTVSTKHGGILVGDLLEQAIRLNELHINCCIEASQNALPKVSIQDEHLDARAWDSKKIQELEGTIETLQGALVHKDEQLKKYSQKIAELIHSIRQVKIEASQGESARLSHYIDQIAVLKTHIKDLETKLHQAKGHHAETGESIHAEHHIIIHNDSLIRRLHEADNTITTLNEANHNLKAQLDELHHQLDNLTLSPDERIMLQDRITKLEGELALSRHRSQLTEGRLRERVHQLLNSVFVLRLQLLKKHGHGNQSRTMAPVQGDRMASMESFEPPHESKTFGFTEDPKLRTNLMSSPERTHIERL